MSTSLKRIKQMRRSKARQIQHKNTNNTPK